MKYAVFTMDVEAFYDTECVAELDMDKQVDMFDGIDQYIELLDKYDIKATLFTLGSRVDELKDSLSHYIKNGHKVALHGNTHTAPLTMSERQFKEETLAAKQRIERTLNIEIDGYRAPCFGLDDKRLGILRDLGFKYDSSKLDFPLARHAAQITTDGFTRVLNGVYSANGFYEFEINTEKLFGNSFPISGGGYTRMIRWNIAKVAIKKYIKNNDYYVFYLHPFEISNQKLPKIKNLKFSDLLYLKMGKRGYIQRINELILLLKDNGYTFTTFEELMTLS